MLRTSLAYSTSQKRLKVLVPIREYMQRHYPVQPLIVEPLFQHYRELLELYNKHKGTILAEIIPQITTNFANIQSLLSFRTQQEQLDRSQTIYSAVYLSCFSRNIGPITAIPLMDLVAASLPAPVNHELEVLYLSELFYAAYIWKIPRADALIEQGLGHFPYFNDTMVKCRFYNSVAHYHYFQNDITLAAELHEKALCFSISTGQTGEQSTALRGLALIKRKLGDYITGQALACESQKAAQLTADLFGEAIAQSIEATCLTYLGSYSMAIAQRERAQSLFALCNMAGGPAAQGNMRDLAGIYHTKSVYIRAQDIHTKLLSCAQEDTFDVALSYLNLADIDISLDRPIQEIQSNIYAARSIIEKLGYSICSAICGMVQANLYLREKNMLAANKDLESILQTTWQRFNGVTTYCLEKLGDIKHWSSVYWTYTWPTVLLVHALKTKQKLVIYEGLQFLGDFFLVEGDQNTATSLFTIALDAFTYMDIHRSRAECMLQLGNISKMNGEFQKAEKHWKLARPLFECSSQGNSIALIDEKLLSIQSNLHKLQPLTVGAQEDEDGLMDHNSATEKEVEASPFNL